MAKITGTHLTERTFSITLDTGLAFRLPLSAYGRKNLTEGSELTEDDISILQDLSQRFLCRERALYYLSLRDVSAREMLQYLCYRKGFDKDISQDTVKELEKEKLIDDSLYAEKRAIYLFKTKNLGPARVRADLHAKGISRETIEKTMSFCLEYSPDEEKILFIAEKKYQGIKNKKNSLEKLRSFLLRKGYGLNQINNVIRKIRSEQEP